MVGKGLLTPRGNEQIYSIRENGEIKRVREKDVSNHSACYSGEKRHRGEPYEGHKKTVL